MSEPQVRRRGARIGACPGMALVVLSFISGTGLQPEVLATWIFPVSVPVGALLGWWHAPAVATAPHLPLGRLLLMAAEAMFLGLAVVAVIGGIGTAISSPEWAGAQGFAAGAAAVVIFGLLFLGLPMLCLTVVCAVAWAWLLRRPT